MDEDEFIWYDVCPKCESICQFEECIIQSGTQLLSKRSYVAFKKKHSAIELPVTL